MIVVVLLQTPLAHVVPSIVGVSEQPTLASRSRPWRFANYKQSQNASAIAFTAPIPSKVGAQGAADTCKDNLRDLMDALCHERRRRDQYRKSRQRQSAFGQRDVEEDDQQTISLDVRS
jgi:hypothetical protein